MKKLELKIKKLYGIQNEEYLTFNLCKINIIFAPNGVGKTSIVKGFENFKFKDQNLKRDLYPMLLIIKIWKILSSI
ncbi:hypothetical protein [Spiroplasma endosymbiont of Amphibalanus improvisus]|uniref:hypothetical protein n=1 Tax=Spiroplasma endosymbiont of Amphibalanus improvisus TaxID=3066327 RepID=UPI00313CDB12